MIDLLPCPFCGGSCGTSTGQYGDGKPFQYIECENCGASGPAFPTDVEAITAWNRRDQWRTDWENAPKGDEPLYVYGRLADEPDEPPFKTLVKWDDESEEWIEIEGLIFEPTHFITPPAPVSGGNK